MHPGRSPFSFWVNLKQGPSKGSSDTRLFEIRLLFFGRYCKRHGGLSFSVPRAYNTLAYNANLPSPLFSQWLTRLPDSIFDLVRQFIRMLHPTVSGARMLIEKTLTASCCELRTGTLYIEYYRL